MYNTSENYKAKVDDGNVSGAVIYGTITMPDNTEISLTEKNLKNGSINVSFKSCTGSKLEIGTAIKGQLSFSFYHEIANQYKLIGSKVLIYYKLDEDIIPLGEFTAATTSRTGNCITLTCYDNMMKLDKSIGNIGTNGTPYSILLWISKNTGIELANTKEEIDNMPNGNEIVNISVGVYSSYTDILKDLSGMLGGFATINREGKLEIRHYMDKPVKSIQPRQRFNTKTSDYECYYTELVSSIDSILYTSTSGDGSGLTYNFSSKLLKGTSSFINGILRNILNKISKIDYVPAEIKIVSDPSIDLGDMLLIIPDGRTLKEEIKTVITSISWTYKSNNTIKSVGENPYLSNSASSSNLSNSTAAAAKNNATYIATYENAESYTINDEEKIISSIDYTNGENDTLIINGQCEIEITLSGNFEIHYYIDGVKNSFTPIQYLTEGKHILNFSCWFSLEESNYLFSVQIGITGTGTGTIAADKVRSYVLGTTLAAGRFYTNNVFEETIPVKTFKNDIYPAGYEKEDENNEL